MCVGTRNIKNLKNHKTLLAKCLKSLHLLPLRNASPRVCAGKECSSLDQSKVRKIEVPFCPRGHFDSNRLEVRVHELRGRLNACQTTSKIAIQIQVSMSGGRVSQRDWLSFESHEYVNSQVSRLVDDNFISIMNMQMRFDGECS